MSYKQTAEHLAAQYDIPEPSKGTVYEMTVMVGGKRYWKRPPGKWQ